MQLGPSKRSVTGTFRLRSSFEKLFYDGKSEKIFFKFTSSVCCSKVVKYVTWNLNRQLNFLNKNSEKQNFRLRWVNVNLIVSFSAIGLTTATATIVMVTLQIFSYSASFVYSKLFFKIKALKFSSSPRKKAAMQSRLRKWSHNSWICAINYLARQAVYFSAQHLLQYVFNITAQVDWWFKFSTQRSTKRLLMLNPQCIMEVNKSHSHILIVS